jgi:signal transduction histidine kinase
MIEIENVANNICITANKGFKLLEDILMWARTQQGSIPFRPQVLNFAVICKEVAEVLKPNADSKNIAINYSESEYLNVTADIDMLKTVLRNLVSNAIKFTNNEGIVSISAQQSDSTISVTVSDNGIGIPAEIMSKLFDLSAVFSSKGTAKETGSGLGLIICKEFIEKHGGKIWAESEEGKGSDFRFTLPVLL